MNIEVTNILVNKPVVVQPIGNRHYALDNEELKITVITKEDGIFKLTVLENFLTDFRSGGPLVDLFIDQIGSTTDKQVCYIFHDAAYNTLPNGQHILSKDIADELLRAMLVFVGVSKWKASMVKFAVAHFGDKAYNVEDQYSEQNHDKIKFEWSAHK